MRKLYSLIVGVLLCAAVSASPSLRIRIAVVQPDGTQLTLVRGGDEHLSYHATEDGYIVALGANGYCYATGIDGTEWKVSHCLAHNAEHRGMDEKRWVAANAVSEIEAHMRVAQSRRISEMRAIGRSDNPVGEHRYPVLLVEFADKEFSLENPVDTFSQQFNAKDFSGNGARGSVRDYFMAQSGGKYKPSFGICGVVKLSRPYAYYGAHSGTSNDARVGEMVKEAVGLAEKQGVDFSGFNDKNGAVPLVAVVFAGLGENTSWDPNTVWSSFYNRTTTTSNGQINSFLVVNELMPIMKKNRQDHTKTDTIYSIEGIGTFCHEFSHFLGLPDFYNTYNSSELVGMSWWSIMDYGQYWLNGVIPMGYTAYEKNFMGWLKIDTLKTEKQVVRINALGSDNENAYCILNDNDASGNEYYIFENRQPSTWYPERLGSGMFVTHVDFSYAAWSGNTVNTNANHKRMSFIAADNSIKPESQSKPADYQGDLFPGITGKTELRDTGVPNFQQFTGEAMDRYLTCITDTSGVVSFVYMAEGILAVPQGLEVDANAGVTSLTARWNAVENATSYRVEVEDAGNPVYSHDFDGCTNDIGGFPSIKQLTLKVWAQADDYITSGAARTTFENPVGIAGTTLDAGTLYDVYDTAGVKLLGGVTSAEISGKLDRGIYVIKSHDGTRKLIVK